MTSATMLPEGFRDRLPPDGDAAAALEAAVLSTAAGHGYERVDPPLAEYEDGLARRLKSAGTRGAVRFVDPVSQRGLAIRPDITAQVSRIATTRMAHHPRPVRLSYAGAVLRLRATELDPERELRQIGCELIGRDNVAAAREVVSVATEGLRAAGLTALSIDFTLPDAVDLLATGPLPLDDEARATVRTLLDAKDAGGVAAIAPAYLPLIQAAGSFAEAIARLRSFDTAGVLASRLDGLEAIARALPDVRLTLDPTERHGFEYQSWFGFSLFAVGATREIGRGGSYAILHENGREEPATGFTLYADAILAARAGSHERRRLFVPLDADPAAAAALRVAGWVTVAALDPEDTPAAQLATHVLVAGRPQPL